MNIAHFDSLAHHLTSIFNAWWLLFTVITGFWSIIVVSSFLIKEGKEKEAQLVFYGGWFWLLVGLISFSGSRIFDYFF